MSESEEQQTQGYQATSPDGPALLRSDALDKLAPALVAAQGELGNPPKDSKNPHFGNTFAGLPITLETIKLVFHKHDLCVAQLMVPSPHGTVGLTTLILHKSGQYLGGTSYFPLERENAQGAGSAITYMRRYGLQAIAAVVGEDDDDGEIASAPVVRKKLFGNRT